MAGRADLLVDLEASAQLRLVVAPESAGEAPIEALGLLLMALALVPRFLLLGLRRDLRLPR